MGNTSDASSTIPGNCHSFPSNTISVFHKNLKILKTHKIPISGIKKGGCNKKCEKSKRYKKGAHY